MVDGEGRRSVVGRLVAEAVGLLGHAIDFAADALSFRTEGHGYCVDMIAVIRSVKWWIVDCGGEDVMIPGCFLSFG